MLARLLLQRAGLAAVTLFGVAVVVFLLLRVAPGDPIAMMIAPGASAEDIARLRASYGFDRPLPVQFGLWFLGIVQGDFGTSISLRVGVGGVLLQRLPATLELSFAALAIALALGGTIAVAGTLLSRRPGEAAIDAANGLLLAVPDFIWALAFVIVLGVVYPVLPLSGRMDPILDLFAEVHLLDPERVLASYPHELSGGMRQRVLIAAAFAAQPRLVVADEPTTALDVTVQREVLRILRDMQRRHGTGVVFVTHDLGVVAQVCDRVTLLFAGKVVETGPAAEMLDRPRHAYTRALVAASPRPEGGTGLQPVPPGILQLCRAEIAAFDRGRAA